MLISPSLNRSSSRDPLGLLHVAMDLADAEAAALEAGGELAHRRLAVAEDDRGAHVARAQQVGAACRASCARRRRDHRLLDQQVGGGRPGDLDRLGVGEELVGELLDRRRHGRARRAGSAAVLGSLVQISSMSGMKPMSSIRSASSITSRLQPLSMILPRPNRSISRPGRRDQHVDALFERLDLVAHLHAADQQRHRELVILAVFLEILGDLRGELAGRLEDQRARHPRAGCGPGRGCRSSAGRSRRSCRCRSGRCR